MYYVINTDRRALEYTAKTEQEAIDWINSQSNGNYIIARPQHEF